MKVHHIGIETADMAAVKRFLQKKGFVLESILELGGETLVFMKRNALLIELSEDSALEQSTFHICFEMEDDQSMPDFPGAERTLYENGWESIFLPGFIGIELLKK